MPKYDVPVTFTVIADSQDAAWDLVRRVTEPYRLIISMRLALDGYVPVLTPIYRTVEEPVEIVEALD